MPAAFGFAWKGLASVGGLGTIWTSYLQKAIKEEVITSIKGELTDIKCTAGHLLYLVKSPRLASSANHVHRCTRVASMSGACLRPM